MIAPALEEISDELGEKVTIAKMDIMENPEVPGQMGVQSIPLMVLFKDGKPWRRSSVQRRRASSRAGSKANWADQPGRAAMRPAIASHNSGEAAPISPGRSHSSTR